MEKKEPSRLGIIGGSGLYSLKQLENVEHRTISTPFGSPSDQYITGSLNGIPMAFLPRHGVHHTLLPSEINYRANIFGMKMLGVTHLLGVTAVGSLREDLAPLDLVVPDQLIDRTRGRCSSFFGNGVVAHVPFGEPFCTTLGSLLYTTAASLSERTHHGATLITMEGPAFSTRAESLLYRQWGADLIGMTTCQEAKLAREAEICFAALAMVTDYDCWRESDPNEVTVETVVANMARNVAVAREVISRMAARVTLGNHCRCHTSLAGAIMTAPEAIPEQLRADLAPLINHRICS